MSDQVPVSIEASARAYLNAVNRAIANEGTACVVAEEKIQTP